MKLFYMEQPIGIGNTWEVELIKANPVPTANDWFITIMFFLCIVLIGYFTIRFIKRRINVWKRKESGCFMV